MWLNRKRSTVVTLMDVPAGGASAKEGAFPDVSGSGHSSSTKAFARPAEERAKQKGGDAAWLCSPTLCAGGCALRGGASRTLRTPRTVSVLGVRDAVCRVLPPDEAPARSGCGAVWSEGNSFSHPRGSCPLCQDWCVFIAATPRARRLGGLPQQTSPATPVASRGRGRGCS